MCEKSIFSNFERGSIFSTQQIYTAIGKGQTELELEIAMGLQSLLFIVSDPELVKVQVLFLISFPYGLNLNLWKPSIKSYDFINRSQEGPYKETTPP